MNKKKAKYRAYQAIPMTNGIVAWTKHHWAPDTEHTNDDVEKFVEVANSLSPQGRILQIQERLKTLDEEASPHIKTHADAIRRIHSCMPIALAGGGATLKDLKALEEAEGLWRDIVVLRDVIPKALHGAKFKPGRPTGAVSKLRKAIRSYLTKYPNAKSADIWKGLSTTHAAGGTFFDNGLGKYIELDISGGRVHNTSYRRFQNIVSEEKKKK